VGMRVCSNCRWTRPAGWWQRLADENIFSGPGSGGNLSIGVLRRSQHNSPSCTAGRPTVPQVLADSGSFQTLERVHSCVKQGPALWAIIVGDLQGQLRTLRVVA
jgi:hypothetical protein